MVYSLWTEQKRPTWSITFYFLTLFVGFMLVEIAHAENQEPFLNNDDTSGPVIGIDLGTSFSRAGIMKDGKVAIIVNDQGQSLFISVRKLQLAIDLPRLPFPSFMDYPCQ